MRGMVIDNDTGIRGIDGIATAHKFLISQCLLYGHRLGQPGIAPRNTRIASLGYPIATRRQQHSHRIERRRHISPHLRLLLHEQPLAHGVELGRTRVYQLKSAIYGTLHLHGTVAIEVPAAVVRPKHSLRRCREGILAQRFNYRARLFFITISVKGYRCIGFFYLTVRMPFGYHQIYQLFVQ